MTQALLFDLDDTLLHNSMGSFLPRYFTALTRAVADIIEREPFLQALQYSTQKMIKSTDTRRTNEELFWANFEGITGLTREVLLPTLDRFYADVFSTLHDDTAPVAGGKDIVAAAKAAGWKVVVATNPIFPIAAQNHRIVWAGLEPGDFDLVTSYENMHSTKPHASYFEEIAQLVGAAPGDCVMVGNHLANDITGAKAAGLRTFWTMDYPIADAEVTPDGQGLLGELQGWLFKG